VAVGGSGTGVSVGGTGVSVGSGVGVCVGRFGRGVGVSVGGFRSGVGVAVGSFGYGVGVSVGGFRSGVGVAVGLHWGGRNLPWHGSSDCEFTGESSVLPSLALGVGVGVRLTTARASNCAGPLAAAIAPPTVVCARISAAAPAASHTTQCGRRESRVVMSIARLVLRGWLIGVGPVPGLSPA
jgi:hypothetical protein